MSKYKGLKSSAILIVLLLGLGLFMVGNSGRSLFVRTFTAPSTLDDLNYEEDIDGAYVRTTVYGIYGSYSETVSSKTRSVKSREYVIDAGNYHYIALKMRSKDLEKAEALMDASFDYLDGKIDVGDLEPYQFEVTGTIEKLPEKHLKYYHEFFDWDELDDESKETVLPYRLTNGDVAGMDTGTMWGILAIGLVIGGFGLYILLVSLTSYEKAIKRFLKSNEGASEEKVREFLANTQEVHSVQVDRNYLFLLAGGSRFYMDIPDHVVWMYKRVTTHRRNGIPTGKTYGVVMDFICHKQFEITVKNEQAADELVQTLSQYCGKAIAGYSNDLDKLYQKNYDQFLALRYNPAEKAE